MKTINIDDFLKERSLQFTLNGKNYIIKDISTKAIEILRSEETGREKEGIKELLQCEDKDLEGYGLVTFNKILKDATENLLQGPSQEDQSKD